MAEIKAEYRSKKSLVIVESPAKAKTIEKYLGKGFEVKSSIGHIRDLKKSEMSIDIDNNFEPQYEVSRGKGKTVTELKRLAKAVDIVWLATDEDREGEAIAWHLYEALKLKPEATKRITFAEITKTALIQAINNPRSIDKHLVDAQQARRVLDRLVGYELSPVLWKKIRYGLSAGRVQSVAVRLIVEREREIEAFQPIPSYKITAEFQVDGDTVLKTQRPDKFKTYNETKEFIESVIGKEYIVAALEKKPGKRSPGAPFTTSKLQQEASAKLGYSVKQTMTLAQKLYENGLITYMRTDSTNLSDQARADAKKTIEDNYGIEYHKERNFKSKSANAQEAHEAIRPTDFSRLTAGIGDGSLESLYRLIRNKALASQMADAKIEKTVIKIDISGTQEQLQATGEVVTFPGFLTVMGMKDNDSQLLPELTLGQKLDLNQMLATETFSKNPARYTEATLVRTLEEKGIGRPSTYSPTISTIQDRGYVVKEDRPGIEREYKIISTDGRAIQEKIEKETFGAEKSKLFPTDTAGVVTDFLIQYFPDVIDYNFTANVEEAFDKIASGEKEWHKMIADFYKDFHPKVEDSENISRQETLKQRLLGNDPKTGRPVFARFGRFGPMIMLGDNEVDKDVQFASIPKNLHIDTIKLEDALPLLELPRIVGETPDGKKIKANRGRFGPYVQLDKTYVSIKEEELYGITYEEAYARIKNKIEEKAKALIHDFEEHKLKVLNGRFGPYITNGKKNVKLPKGLVPEDLTADECLKIFKEAPAKKGRGRKK